MNVRIEGNCKKPTKQWPNNLYYECEFIAEHYLNTLVKFWNFSHRISRLRAIDCSNCDCVSRHDDCSRGWDFISGVWPFSNFFLNIGRERRWPRWIKKASHIGSKRLWEIGLKVFTERLVELIVPKLANDLELWFLLARKELLNEHSR